MHSATVGEGEAIISLYSSNWWAL